MTVLYVYIGSDRPIRSANRYSLSEYRVLDNAAGMIYLYEIERDMELNGVDLCIEEWDAIRFALIKETNPVRAYKFAVRFIDAIKNQVSVSLPVYKVERIGLA